MSPGGALDRSRKYALGPVLRPSASLLAWTLLGCSPSLALVELPLPPTKSLVLVLIPEGGAPEVQAVEFSGETPPLVTVPSARDAQVYVLSYLCSLAAVGLQPGPARLDPVGSPLPEPSAVRSGQVRGGIGAPWQEEPGLPASLRDLKLARQEPSRCLSFTQQNVQLPAPLQSAALLGDDQVALALLSGLHVYDLPGLSPRKHWLLPSFGPEPRGAARASDGSVHFAGGGGSIDVVTPDLEHHTSMARTGTTPDYNGRVRVAVPTEGPADELFIATEQGRVERWDGSAWHLLFEDAHPVAGNQADVVWIGPGRILVVGIVASDLLEFAEGRSMSTHVLDRGGKLARILLHPTRGRLYFTADGRLVTPKGGGTFEETALAALGQRSVTGVLATEHGFLASAYVGGTISQFDFGQGECAPLVVDLDNIETMLPFGHQYFVFGRDYAGDGRVVIMTPTKLPEQCR